MKSRITIWILLVISTQGCSQRGEQMIDVSPAQRDVDLICTRLTKGEVKQVEILQIPADILTRTRVTPETLERSFDYKLTIRDIRGGAYEKGLENAMKSLKVYRETEIADLRWGIIFYSKDGDRIAAVYFGKHGRGGAVGNTPASFSGTVCDWLDSNFANCLR